MLFLRLSSTASHCEAHESNRGCSTQREAVKYLRQSVSFGAPCGPLWAQAPAPRAPKNAHVAYGIPCRHAACQNCQHRAGFTFICERHYPASSVKSVLSVCVIQFHTLHHPLEPNRMRGCGRQPLIRGLGAKGCGSCSRPLVSGCWRSSKNGIRWDVKGWGCGWANHGSQPRFSESGSRPLQKAQLE